LATIPSENRRRLQRNVVAAIDEVADKINRIEIRPSAVKLEAPGIEAGPLPSHRRGREIQRAGPQKCGSALEHFARARPLVLAT